MRLIVTRPRAQAALWVAELQALGADAHALPLIGIAAAPDPQAVRTAWEQLASFDLAVFVSPNAVQQFFALAPAGMRWPPALLAGSTGPGTSAALQAAGVAAPQRAEPPPDAASFDSEALWAQLVARGWDRADAAGRRVLVVRGDGGRSWLADTLRAHGATVEFVAAYQRRPPAPDDAQRALLAAAIAQPAGHAWLFSSSEALQHLASLAPAADWSRAVAVASHPRIAEAVRAAGFGRVALAAPAPAAVLAAVSEVALSAVPALAQSGPL